MIDEGPRDWRLWLHRIACRRPAVGARAFRSRLRPSAGTISRSAAGCGLSFRRISPTGWRLSRPCRGWTSYTICSARRSQEPPISIRRRTFKTISSARSICSNSMQRLGLSRILFLSSGGTVYGIPDTIPIPETHALRPINSYGIVKATIEHYLEMYRRTRGLSPIIVRASNPFGPRQAHSGVQGVISTFLRRILAGQPLEIWGDGTVVRDYLEVGDLAELCVRAGTSDREGAYNAGSGHGLSVNDIVRSHSQGDRIGFRNRLQTRPPRRRPALGVGLFPRKERFRMGMQDLI